MTEHVLSISEAQKELTRLPDQFFDEEIDTVTVTRYGKPVMTILSSETYQTLREAIQRLQEQVDALQETLEILQDEETLAAFRRGVADLKAGNVIPWEEAKKELGLS